MKIAVIGVGGTGSAACRHLAKAGHEVVGFERFRLDHSNGSSHGESRIIRYTYPDLLYTRMMAEAYPLWSELEAEAGEDLLVRCGGVYLGPESHPQLQRTEAALRETGLPYQRLTADALQDRFPALRLLPGEVALYQTESGFLRSSRCVLANARLAQKHGATLYEETEVTEIVSRSEEVVVRTANAGEFRFDRVIVTTGAWMGELFARLNLPLTVTRQQVAYLQIAQNSPLFEPGRLPVWIDKTHGYYGFPSDGSLPGVKLASHDLGAIVTPENVERTLDAAYLEQVRGVAARRLPDLGPEVTFSTTCLYTNTPNEDFILDHAPDAHRVLLVSGCSGHGFKFTILLGKIAADLTTGAGYPGDLSRFALQRFTQ
jgi:sarcosine oxidase